MAILKDTVTHKVLKKFLKFTIKYSSFSFVKGLDSQVNLPEGFVRCQGDSSTMTDHGQKQIAPKRPKT